MVASSWRVLRARAMLLGAAALWGTYAVVLRALYSLPGTKMAPIFITAVRYSLMAAIAMPAQLMALPSHRGFLRHEAGFFWASIELGLIGCVSNLLSCWGISKMPALVSETL